MISMTRRANSFASISSWSCSLNLAACKITVAFTGSREIMVFNVSSRLLLSDTI